MEHIVVERDMAKPMTVEIAAQLYDQGNLCLELYRVNVLRSYIAIDGSRMTCLYQAPDAEAVRHANRRNEHAYREVWKSSLHGPGHCPPAAGKERVIVERQFDVPVVFDELQAQEDAAGWCLDLHKVSFVETLMSADRKRLLCLYDAPDAESVRTANRQTELPFKRVWTATIFAP